jgi:glycosyltransferase involved in cell wall biosynthesis
MNFKNGKLFIVAYNIHEGGGAVLLRSLIEQLSTARNIVLVLDSRFELDMAYKGNFETLIVSSFGRLLSEFFLKLRIRQEDTVLFMGNLPPLFSLHAKVCIYFQNLNILAPYKLSLKYFYRNLKKFLQRIWLHKRRRNYQFLVQTESVRLRLKDFGIDNLITICPFYGAGLSISRTVERKVVEPIRKNFDFIYIASGEEHKNHTKLLEAWTMLAEAEVYPSLCLTVDPKAYPVLCSQINNLSTKFALEIQNIGLLQHDMVADFYGKSGALIYPSLSESFGLPLIEARALNLPILAPELDYVRELIDPEETFNPDSPRSIALAVTRFLSIQPKTTTVNSTENFIKFLVDQKSYV